jgi:hypothetical protein
MALRIYLDAYSVTKPKIRPCFLNSVSQNRLSADPPIANGTEDGLTLMLTYVEAIVAS